MAELLLYLPATGVAEASPGKKKKKGDIEVGKEEGNSGSKGGFVELKGCCTFRATGYRCVGLPVRVGRMPTTWGRKQL